MPQVFKTFKPDVDQNRQEYTIAFYQEVYKVHKPIFLFYNSLQLHHFEEWEPVNLMMVAYGSPL